MPRSLLARALVLAVLCAPVAAAADVTVFLDPRGGTITGGEDDAAAGVSWIAQGGPGGRARVPAWTGGARRWAQVVACVQDHFADFRVDIVDQPPAGDDHVRVMVGGRPALVGQARWIGGIAPWDGSVLRGAVGFVFSASLGNRVDAVCEAIAHEIGHTLGLEHTLACEDLMSYQQCGEKRFRIESSPCGEEEARTCGGGEETQSSYQLLARNVGLRQEPGPAPAPEAEAAPEPAPDTDAGPTVEVEVDEHLAGNRWIRVTVRAQAGDGLAGVWLGWASADEQLLIGCADAADDERFRCHQDGDRFVFEIHAGVGARALAAAALDVNGGQAVTAPRLIWLDGDEDE